MSDPITINIDAGWLTRAWACIPKTAADFKSLPGKIAGKVWNSITWAAYHTQVWLALAAAFIAGAALSPLIRPHLAANAVPMVQAENIAPPVVNVDLTKTTQLIEGLHFKVNELKAIAKQTNDTAAATSGNVARLNDWADHAPEMLRGMFAFGLAETAPQQKPAQPSVAPAKTKPAPVAKRPPAATPEAAKPVPVPEAPAIMSIPDWLKSKL